MKVEIKPVLFIFFVFLFSLFVFPPKVSAQVVINEVHPKEEWVELYNIDDNEASLEGCILYMHKDKYKPQSIEFSASDSVSKFKLIKKGEYNWSTNWLNDGEDTVFLECPLNTDSVSHGGGSSIDSPEDKSIGRSPDGTEDFSVLSSSTPGEPNSSPPTPKPTSTPTPTPGSTPSPTPTPTKTPTATPKPTVKAVVTKKPKIISSKTTSDEEESEVLGLREGLEPPSPTPIPESEEKRKVPITAILFVLGGLGFMGVAGYPFLKSMKKRYNIENEEKETAERDFKPGDS